MLVKLALYCALKLEVKQPLWATFKLRVYFSVLLKIQRVVSVICKHIDSFPKKYTQVPTANIRDHLVILILSAIDQTYLPS